MGRAAFEWLGHAIEGRDPLVMSIKTCFFMEPVRDYPRHRALLHKMNLV